MSTSNFYTLRADAYPLALGCVVMTDSMMRLKETQKTALLTGEFQEAYKRLYKALVAMQDENGASAPQNLPLDARMTFAMLHAIVQSFYRMKGHLLLPKSERKPISEEQEAEIENMYDEMKEAAAELLWELTEVLGYPDYGLQTLEEVFDRKPAVRPLKVDNQEIIFNVTIQKPEAHLFTWVYTSLDLLKLYKEEYDFAYRLHSCRFMHPSDYEALKNKLFKKPVGEKVAFTLRDIIVLYYTLSLMGKLFVSEADAIFDELAKESSRTDPQLDLRNVRNHFLKQGDQILSLLKKEFRHNKTFMLEIDRVKSW